MQTIRFPCDVQAENGAYPKRTTHCEQKVSGDLKGGVQGDNHIQTGFFDLTDHLRLIL